MTFLYFRGSTKRKRSKCEHICWETTYIFRYSLLVLVQLLLLQCTTCYRYYQDQIPNGDQVPHPCKPNFIWRGVGHLSALGGGDNNQFGLDFANNGHKWTKTLCELDSDGDGKSNGMELGDPSCSWTAASGNFPERKTGITHPGVCDPLDSPLCESMIINCDTEEFICPAINESHVRNITLRFPRTLVPAVETTYMCMTFDLEFPDEYPADQEFHLIATQPVIDNPNVMHHITVSGCVDTASKIPEPKNCFMTEGGCSISMGLWTLGMAGECIYHEAGFKIGGKGTHTVMMQFHWTNPELVTDYWDSSGMILYYTPKLRKYNAGFFYTGQTRLEIPAGQPRVTQKSTCSSECTQENVDNSVYITTGLNHMHYLGYQQNVEMFRNDEKVRDLTKDDVYSYDNPIIHLYDPPVELLPGDRLETTCTYRSLSRTTTTYFGEGTFNEMCYGIFTVFPIENLTRPTCITWGSIELCGLETGPLQTCNMSTFFNASDPETSSMRRTVLDSCNFYGACRPECPEVLAKVKEHPCLQGEVGEYAKWALSWSLVAEDIKFLSALSSCSCPINVPSVSDSQPDNAGKVIGLSLIMIAASLLVYSLG
ncbi:dopamine beta-hydroxylase-like [Haliotis cracherodii]|uniref:dopamine beta-hydroxylase-like n=1 Tax=Haliotis cracherodii TaxID=6455 RepID=UPI0039EA0791